MSDDSYYLRSPLEMSKIFSVENLGDQPLKNLARPVHAYRLRPIVASAPPPAPAAGAPARERVDKPAIAVLPLDNMSGEPEQEFFADGITEDIITAVALSRPVRDLAQLVVQVQGPAG